MPRYHSQPPGQRIIISCSRNPRKCYCNLGFFGNNCELESPLKEKLTSFEGYKRLEMSPTYTLYWKVLEELAEIEFAVRSESKSWVAVGWRPTSLTKACKSFWGEGDGQVPRMRFRRAAERKEFTPRGEFHEMDCTDIVIGVAAGEVGRVVDSYTRDRSTPLPDLRYGGQSDLTAALAYEEGNRTVMVFRKPLAATHPSDHSIEEGLMHVIWAEGQKPGKYSHSPRSGIEADNPEEPDFYKEDEIKYHGRKNRGERKLELLTADRREEPSCSFRFPPGCGGDCQYEAVWQLTTEGVKFLVSSSSADHWTGIGFSANTFMVSFSESKLSSGLAVSSSPAPELCLVDWPGTRGWWGRAGWQVTLLLHWPTVKLSQTNTLPQLMAKLSCDLQSR